MLLVAAGGLAGCATLSTPLEPPEINLVGLELVDSTLTRQRFRLTLQLNNPNSIGVPIRAMSYQVQLQGEDFANGRLETPFTLPGKGSELVKVEVAMDTLATLGNLARALRGAPSVLDYAIRGSLQVDLPFVKPLNVTHSGQVPLMMP